MIMESLSLMHNTSSSSMDAAIWTPSAIPSYVNSVLVTAVLLLLLHKLWHQHVLCLRDKDSSLPLPPGSFGLPFVGETLSLALKGARFHTDRRQTYGNVFKTHILGRPTIRIVGPENVRQILKHKQDLLTTQWPASVRMILGDGSLSVASGHVHKMRRKCIMKAFSHDALSGYVTSIQPVIIRYLTTWSGSDVTLAYPEIRKMMFAIACKTLLGFKMDAVEESKMLLIFENLTNNIFSLPICFPGTGLYKGMKAREALLSHIEVCLEKRPLDITDGATDGFSHILRQMGTDMSKADLKDAALELLFAGHETLSSAASSMLMQLGKNPRVVHRAYAEISEAELEHAMVGPGEGGEEKITFGFIQKLDYVNNIVKEVLRLLPPVGGGFRKAMKTFEVNGHQIPRGWSVNFSIRETQLISDKFSDAETFYPDRWNDVTERDLHKQFEFIPFGGGSRACAGREFARLVLKLFAVELIRNWSFKLINENPEMSMFPSPKPKDNLPVRIRSASVFRKRAFTF